MSARDTCYDNALTERLFHSQKVEDMDGPEASAWNEMRAIALECIEVSYNRT